MSSEHATGAPQGPLPAVHDEASDTPTWIPVTGLVLFVMMLLWMLYRAAAPEETVLPPADTAEVADEAAPAE